MTITQPNRNKQLSVFFRIVGAGIFVGVLAVIFVNNQVVNVRHAVKEKLAEVETLRVQNADLKNQYYAMTDTKTSASVASRLGLVKESSPSYLNILSDSTALSLR